MQCGIREGAALLVLGIGPRVISRKARFVWLGGPACLDQAADASGEFVSGNLAGVVGVEVEPLEDDSGESFLDGVVAPLVADLRVAEQREGGGEELPPI